MTGDAPSNAKEGTFFLGSKHLSFLVSEASIKYPRIIIVNFAVRQCSGVKSPYHHSGPVVVIFLIFYPSHRVAKVKLPFHPTAYTSGGGWLVYHLVFNTMGGL